MAIALTVTTLFLTSILYFTGWMYLYYYLLEFSFSIFEARIPFHYFIVYSFAVLDGYFNLSIKTMHALLAFSIAYVALDVFYRSQIRDSSKDVLGIIVTKDQLRFVAMSTIIALTLFGFWSARFAAKISAEYQAEALRDDPRPHLILLKQEIASSIADSRVQTEIGSPGEYLIQDSGRADWQSFIVDVVLADSESYFLLLYKEDAGVEIPIRLRRSDVIYIGSPDRRLRGSAQ